MPPTTTTPTTPTSLSMLLAALLVLNASASPSAALSAYPAPRHQNVDVDVGSSSSGEGYPAYDYSNDDDSFSTSAAAAADDDRASSPSYSPSYLLEARLRRAPKTSKVEAIGCRGFPPSAAVFRELNLVCEDCFRLFRDQEIYHMCRSDCFGSDFFLGCMDYLIYDSKRVSGLAGLVRNVHSFVKRK